MSDSIWCAICEGGGKCAKGYCEWTREHGFRTVLTGEHGDCPGCDGTGISERARRERAKRSSP